MERTTLQINQSESQTRKFEPVEIKLRMSPSPSKEVSQDKEEVTVEMLGSAVTTSIKR